jgi:hypothetical protein
MMFSRIIVLGCLITLAAQAQTSSAPEQAPKEKVAVSQQAGDAEIGFFTGAVIPPGGSGATVGGGVNVAFALSTYIYPFFEFSVLPGALNQQQTVDSVLYKTTGNLADFHGGVHIRLPISGHPQFVPYLVFAVGGYKPFSASTSIIDTSTNPPTTDQTIPITAASFIFNYGGGVRYYVNNHVGVKFEFTAYGPTSHFNGGTPMRVMAGVFFQLKKHSH